MATDVNLFDLTNQPTGIILGESEGTPLYSIEENNTFQHSTTPGLIIRDYGNGVETIKYSTDFASTEANNIYQVTFDIRLRELPGNIGTEAKIEFQNGIDGDIGSTFFELPYDEIINLDFGNSGEYTTFTAQYTSPLEGQSILQIKATEFRFNIKNIQVESLGVGEDGEEDEILDEGGSADSVYIRACICDDSGAANQLGSFEEDFLNWAAENDGANINDFNGEGLGAWYDFSLDYDIPEGVYPTNCIGFEHAKNRFKSKYTAFQDENIYSLNIIHDPQLCIFGGAELDNDKQNLIGLTNGNFIDNNLFNINDSLNEYSKLKVLMGEDDEDYNFIFLNKSGVKGDKVSLPFGDEDFVATLYYDFGATKTTTYYPQMNYNGDVDEYNDVTWPYKSFSYSFNPSKVEPFPWISNYTTSENIYPYYNHEGKPEEKSIPVVLMANGGSDINDLIGDEFHFLFPGKCPPQFQGEEKDNKFGTHTLSGFGPMMCSHKHFDKVFNDWMEGDNIQNPLIKPSSPSGTFPDIETNPDASDVEIPLYANFPGNPTYNFIKQEFDEIYPDSYKKYLLIKIKADKVNHFVTIKYQKPGGTVDIIYLTEPDESGDINVKIDITDITPDTVDVDLNGSNFKEQYGMILFTPAESDLNRQSSIQYNFTHEFISDETQKDVIKSNFMGDIENGYNGVKFYNYGSTFYNFNIEDFNLQLNTHFEQLWKQAGSRNSEDDGFGNTIYTADNRFEGTSYYVDDNTTSTVNYYPQRYWSWEFDEQRELADVVGGMSDYTNYYHWTDPYSLGIVESESQNSNHYWQYDNQDLYSYFIDSNTEGGFNLDIELLYDNQYQPIPNNIVASNVPWPEQIINGFTVDPNDGTLRNGSMNEDNEYKSVLDIFNGSYGNFTLQGIFISGTLQFSGEFGVDGFDIDLNPSLDKSYDPFSGIDLRPNIIDENICQHIELMTRQNLSTGDGVFYKASEHPLAEGDEQLVTCNTFINFDFYPFTKIRARCGDGSVVLMGDTGDGDTLNYPQDFFHSSGIDACTYASNHIRSYPNNEQFHFGANLDKRPSLGLFYYEEDNQASENFTANLGDEFQQYPNANLVTNPDGSLIESYIEKSLEGIGFDGETFTWRWYLPQGGWQPMGGGVDGFENSGENETQRFIQSDDFDSTLGLYRYTGWEDFSGNSYSSFNDASKGYYFNGWIFERTYFTHRYISPNDTSINYGPANKDFLIDLDGDSTNDVRVSRHPYCHSAGKCLNFQSHPKIHNDVDITITNGNNLNNHDEMTSVQELLTTEEATTLFYHDIQSTPDLKVSFWMYTSSDGVFDLDNPDFPEIEIGVTKDNLIEGGTNNFIKPYGDLHSLSYPNYIAGTSRFKNTVLDEWEQFEFSFNLQYSHFYDSTERTYHPLYLFVQYHGIKIIDIDNNTPADRYENIYGNVYLDDFSVMETGAFIPDVDVRAKKGEGNYGIGSLTEYYDPMIEGQLESYNDTTAPLEAQFVFYPRFFNEQVFDRENTLENRFGTDATFSDEVIKNDFRRGRFYLYDVDFGDGSEKEYTDKPLRLGNDVAVYHTYTKSGIYEVTGYMLRTRPSKNEDGTPNHDEPIGVLHNKKFTVRINVNEGLDEDFIYFGSEDGFSYIPYKNTSPVIGGISKESSYYKAIKRQLGFITDEVKTSIFFEKESDKLKTEIALSKIDSSLSDGFEILPEFQIPRYSEPNNSSELIYGGITTIEEELGKTLGNVDLTNARYFNEPKEIYQMFGFTCDNNQTEVDLIPLGKPEYGLNYSNHSRTFTDRSDIQSPYFSNVSKVVNSDKDGNLLVGQGTPDNSEANPIRFGHDFRIDNIEGLGSGQWTHIDGAFVDISAFDTPDLGYNQTYTYSTHIYIPFGYCEDGNPCSENGNQYTVKCSECNGTQQYDEGSYFNVRIVQNMNDSEDYANDWVHDLWLDDIVGGQWANQHNIGYGINDEYSFKYKQFDAFNHCHPKGVNNPRFKYGWSNGKVFPIRDGFYCSGFNYQECGFTNPSGEADGCYWEGDENNGTCMAANLTNNAGPPFNVTCWSATTEGECIDGCEWYGDGSDNASFETAISTPHEDIITDEWFRLDFPFTTKEPSEYGNHISLRFDTHLGVNRITLEYSELTGESLVTNGSFNDPTNDISDEYLADLSSPTCFEEYDIAGQDGILNVTDRQIWYNPQADGAYGRPDISAKIIELILADDTVEAAGGYCPNGYDGIDYEIFRNPSIGGWFLESWELNGDTNFSSAKINIPFNDSPSSVEQSHLRGNTSYDKMYKLKYEVIQPTTEEDSKLLIVASPNGYIVEQSIELPTDVAGVQEVIFTSDNETASEDPIDEDPNRDDTGNQEGDEGEGLSVFYERTLIIGHLGGYNNNDSVIIDNVELYEVTENQINTTTANEGLYTFGAQLLAGDFSGDDLINYTTEDLNPGDCVDFQSGNPENKRYWKNIIPQNYNIFARGVAGTEYFATAGNLMPHPQDEFLGASPSGTELSDFWYYDEDDLSCVYNEQNNSYTATLLQENASQGDGEEFKARFSRPEYHGLPELMAHMVGDCDSFSSCLARLDEENLSHWYQFKFTYENHIPQTSNSDNVPVPQPIESIGVRFKSIIKVKANNWDMEYGSPNDGTSLLHFQDGGEPTLWIYGDSSTDYQGEKHPDFWEQANCVEGEECIVWILFQPFGGNYYDNYNHEIGFLNGRWGNNSVTVWKNLSLIRGDEIIDYGGVPTITDIDYNSEQEWLGTNEYGNTYYYPVLPRFGLNGKFESANNQFYPGGDYDYPNDNIPFPIEASVTEENPQEQSMLINIYNDVIETNVFSDGSGNDNNAFTMNDYKPKYNEQTSEPQSIKNVDRIRTSKDKGAF